MYSYLRELSLFFPLALALLRFFFKFFFNFDVKKTGKSKGVMLTHRNITSNLVQIMSYDAEVIKQKDLVILGFLPLYHIYGLMNCLHISLITVRFLSFLLILLVLPNWCFSQRSIVLSCECLFHCIVSLGIFRY